MTAEHITNDRKDYESLTKENPINLMYLQTIYQLPNWQIEDYFVL
jgi:hypothetical protein